MAICCYFTCFLFIYKGASKKWQLEFNSQMEKICSEMSWNFVVFKREDGIDMNRYEASRFGLREFEDKKGFATTLAEGIQQTLNVGHCT